MAHSVQYQHFSNNVTVADFTPACIKENRALENVKRINNKRTVFINNIFTSFQLRVT